MQIFTVVTAFLAAGAFAVPMAENNLAELERRQVFGNLADGIISSVFNSAISQVNSRLSSAAARTTTSRGAVIATTTASTTASTTTTSSAGASTTPMGMSTTSTASTTPMTTASRTPYVFTGYSNGLVVIPPFTINYV